MKGHCPCVATGLSSHAIANAFGHCRMGGKDHPWDPADLRRCVDYCRETGISNDRLAGVMETVSPQWAALVAEWPALVDLLHEEIAEGTGRAPRTYDAMKRALGQR